MKILIIYNPVAGGEENEQLLQSLFAMARKKGHETEVYKTTGSKDLEAITTIIGKYEPDRLVVKGGDGTISLVCKALLRLNLQVPLGIIPAGSANGLAVSLDLPTDQPTIIETAMSSYRFQPIDILVVNEDHLCVHLLDVGINARLIRLYEEREMRGMLGYALQLVPAVKDSPMLTYTIQVNGTTYEKAGYMLTCANGKKYGTGVAVSNGSIDDGTFEMSVLGEFNLGDAIKSGLTIFNIMVEDHMFSDVIPCREADVRIYPRAPLQIDGEYLGEVDHLQVRIQPAAVQIIMPE